jgi:tetratricopeptide (TPR) repeat protein
VAEAPKLMEKSGQLTFSDDTLLTGSNEISSLIESGDFAQAVLKGDLLLARDPHYPGLEALYRAARYWQVRADESLRKSEGIDRASFLMEQWESFTEYADEKGFIDSTAFIASRKFVFFTAAEHYKTAFHQNQTERFGNLLNLGICFMNLGEYRHAIDAFEYAKSSSKADAKLYSLLAESYYHIGDIPKSLLLFREAFSLDPASIDMSMIKAKPILDLALLAKRIRPQSRDEREWIPIAGQISDTFYVKRQINTQQLEGIKKEVYTLEKNYQSLSPEQRDISPVTPRLIVRYLMLFDYFTFQNYNYENASQIRERLIEIDKGIFMDYFKNIKR